MQPWWSSLGQLKTTPEKYLKPGRYVAVIKNSPFFENPLASAHQEDSWGIVYGISARSEDGR